MCTDFSGRVARLFRRSLSYFTSGDAAAALRGDGQAHWDLPSRPSAWQDVARTVQTLRLCKHEADRCLPRRPILRDETARRLPSEDAVTADRDSTASYAATGCDLWPADGQFSPATADVPARPLHDSRAPSGRPDTPLARGSSAAHRSGGLFRRMGRHLTVT